MRIEPELSSASIHLRGGFNPAILTPDWLAQELKVVSSPVNLNLRLVHPEIASLDGEWFSLQATREVFTIHTSEAPFVRIADMTARIFGNRLSHTPIWSLTITRTVHFSAGTESIQHRIGRMLAPTAPWGWWGDEIEHASRRSGLSQLAMKHNSQEPPFDRAIIATVQPSEAIRPNLAIHMEILDQYTLPAAEKTTGCQEVITKLSGGFDQSIKQSETIIDQIMSLKEKCNDDK